MSTTHQRIALTVMLAAREATVRCKTLPIVGASMGVAAKQLRGVGENKLMPDNAVAPARCRLQAGRSYYSVRLTKQRNDLTKWPRHVGHLPQSERKLNQSASVDSPHSKFDDSI